MTWNSNLGLTIVRLLTAADRSKEHACDASLERSAAYTRQRVLVSDNIRKTIYASSNTLLTATVHMPVPTGR